MMDKQPNLADALARCRDEAVEWEPLYNDFVARMRRLDVGAGAPSVGDRFPEFALLDSRGRLTSLSSRLAQGPVVLSFNRGGWCPYCRAELSAWSDSLFQLAEAGAQLVVVTAEIAGRAEELRRSLGLAADVLCDIDHGVALDLGLAVHLGQDLRREYLDCGLDLAEVYGSPSWLIPIPATFLIDPAGIVRFAYVDVDFRNRAEPADVIAAVQAL